MGFAFGVFLLVALKYLGAVSNMNEEKRNG
jgi:hypothetical protein